VTLVSQRLRDAPRDVDFDCVRCRNPEACLCHLPAWDAGTGQKCDDWQGAHLCAECHAYFDGPQGRHDFAARFLVLTRTLRRLFEHGILEVRGETHY